MLKNKLRNYKIILASQSSRRQELLKGLDIDFEIKVQSVNEHYSSELQGVEITDYLSELKATPFTQDLKKEELLITSDTIVWLNGQALEKPRNLDHAREMLMKMSGQTHSVFTSVSFTTVDGIQTINDETRVTFKNLDVDEIDYYLKIYQPYDRAGAYGIQDWIGYVAINKIDGCYYNVMGLPLPKVYAYLSKL
ncbi:MAG: Maf family nucleotide pyrophosphatase [Nonlabens sp.]